jgi:hypothetical protein
VLRSQAVYLYVVLWRLQRLMDVPVQIRPLRFSPYYTMVTLRALSFGPVVNFINGLTRFTLDLKRQLASLANLNILRAAIDHQRLVISA